MSRTKRELPRKELCTPTEVLTEIERLAAAYDFISISHDGTQWCCGVHASNNAESDDFYGETLAIAVGRASYRNLP